MGRAATAPKSLYLPDERLSADDFLVSKFGKGMPTPEERPLWRKALIRQVHESPLFALSNFFYVADKAGDLVLLTPFVGQAMLDVAIESQRRNGLPVRIATVKARQVGWTVWIMGRGLHFCLDFNKRGLVLVDDEDVAAEQATRLGTMLNGLPPWLQPMRRIQNMKHLVFDNPNPKDRIEHPGLNAAIQITVPSSFRGVPPGFVQISEYAHMDSQRQMDVQIGIISALSAHAMLVIDTTPAGFDDSYQPMVEEACEENPKWVRRIEEWKGEISVEEVLDGCLGVPDVVAKGYPNLYVPAMCPWRFHEEYSCRTRQNPRGEFKSLTKEQRAETEASLGRISKYGGEEELENRDRYGLSTERAFWRRRKIDAYKLPTEEMKLLAFRQEFYTNIRSAFIDSGTCPFDRTSLDVIKRQEREPSAIGLFDLDQEVNHLPVFRPHEQTEWEEVRIYAPPQEGEKYTMGVDCDQAYESPDSDATVAQVVRYRDNKIVLSYEARVPSWRLRKQLYAIYRWYFNCYYAIETKGMGFDLVRQCMDMGMNNVHYWKRYDKDVPEPSSYPGWETTGKTRPLMDQTATELICARDRHTGNATPEIIIPDAKTLKEIRGLARTPTGSFKSPRGHDDHYDALCIALCIARDPYSGLSRHVEEEEDKKKREFHQNFARLTGVTRDRNRPSLENL